MRSNRLLAIDVAAAIAGVIVASAIRWFSIQVDFFPVGGIGFLAAFGANQTRHRAMNSAIVLAFTATRKGITLEQIQSAHEIVSVEEPTKFLHGCAEGGDRQLHDVATPGRRELCPSRKEQFRWALDNVVEGDEIRDIPTGKNPEITRNRRMVDRASVLVACPESATEIQRSGTWATIRYARTLGRRIAIISPNGDVSWTPAR